MQLKGKACFVNRGNIELPLLHSATVGTSYQHVQLATLSGGIESSGRANGTWGAISLEGRYFNTFQWHYTKLTTPPCSSRCRKRREVTFLCGYIYNSWFSSTRTTGRQPVQARWNLHTGRWNFIWVGFEEMFEVERERLLALESELFSDRKVLLPSNRYSNNGAEVYFVWIIHEFGL